MIHDPRYFHAPIPIRRSIDEWSPETPLPAAERRVRIGGVDLGQASDRSAITVLERRVVVSDAEGKFVGPSDPYIRLAKIRRYAEGLDYMLQVDDLLAFPGLDVMVVEYNGVGRPVVDRLRQRAREVGYRGRIVAVVTAASNSRLHETTDKQGQVISVPKINMVTSINLLMQQKVGGYGDNVLRIEATDEETRNNLKTLKKEMRDFQMRITRNANATFGNVEGPGKHDDLVMSLALASWYILNRMRRLAVYIP